MLDFDGTLADSQDWFLGVFDQVADRFGYHHLAPGDRERLRGLETRAILSDLGVPLWKLPMIAKHLRELATRDIDRIGLFHGSAAMLEAVRAGGVQIAVVSSNDENNVRRVLGEAAAHIAFFACGASLFGKAGKIHGALKALRAEAKDAVQWSATKRATRRRRETWGSIADWWRGAMPIRRLCHSCRRLCSSIAWTRSRRRSSMAPRRDDVRILAGA